MSKPNILFIAPFRQYCGWGQGVKDYARALSTIGNVTIRNIFLSSQRERDLPPDLQILEDNKFDHYDILIQKVIPNLYYYDGRFKQNIGLMVFETKMNRHSWFNKINMMDKLFVPSVLEKNQLESRLKTPVFHTSEPLDITIANTQYIPINPVLVDKTTFKFLFIGESIQRKGINELLRAYLMGFTSNDNVLLIIKTNRDLSQEINQCKQILRRFNNDARYPLIWLISDRLNENQLYSLHQYCDVFVMPSYGEAFNRPSAISLIFGKPVIATDNTSITDYLNNQIGWLVDSTEESVYCHQPPMADLYTSNECWNMPSVGALQSCMQDAYYNKDICEHKSNLIKEKNIKEQFSYKNIGQKILKAINV